MGCKLVNGIGVYRNKLVKRKEDQKGVAVVRDNFGRRVDILGGKRMVVNA